MVRVYDVSEPRKPKKIHEKKIGAHVNMVSQSWDGERIYFTSSVLSQWDVLGTLPEGSKLSDPDADHFLKAFTWDGKTLEATFEIDFLKEGLGRPHIMRFGAEAFGKGKVAGTPGQYATVP
jgi:selenium-binding protein 1